MPVRDGVAATFAIPWFVLSSSAGANRLQVIGEMTQRAITDSADFILRDGDLVDALIADSIL